MGHNCNAPLPPRPAPPHPTPPHPTPSHGINAPSKPGSFMLRYHPKLAACRPTPLGSFASPETLPSDFGTSVKLPGRRHLSAVSQSPGCSSATALQDS
ncbi:hypothetical protein GN956_G4835 [Arapaima gigas]